MPLVLSPQGRAKPIAVGPLDPLRSEAPELWRGASALISIGDQGAPANVVTRARLTVSGSPLRVATPWGLAHRHGTGTGQGAVIPGYGVIDGDTAGAFLVVFRLRPFGSSKDPIVCIQQGTSTAHLCYLRREADGQLRMFLRGANVDYWGWTSTGWASGELYAALVTADSTGNRVWRNGRRITPTYVDGSAASTQWLSSLPSADTWRLAAFFSPSQLVGDVELLHYAHWSRALTTAEAEAVSSDPWAMVRPRRTQVAGASAAPAAETILLPRLTGAGQLYTPAVAAAPHPVTLPALTGSASLFAPEVSRAAHPVTLPGLTAAGQLFAPAVLAGTAGDTVQLPRLTGAAAVFSPTVTQASHPVLLPQLGGGAALLAPELVHAPHPITLPHLAGATALFSPSLAQAAHVAQLPLLAGGGQLYPPTLVHGAQSVALPLLAAAAVLYAPTVRALGKPVTVRFDFGGAPTRTFDFQSIR